MHRRLELLAAAIVVGLALLATSTQAIGDATTAAGCSNQTVDVATHAGNVTLRFVLHGVSCSKAHTLIRTYFRHQATAGYCVKQGNICAFASGGWTCSLPLYAGEGGGDFAGCSRSPGTWLRVYRVTGRASMASEPSTFTVAGELSGVAAASASDAWAVGSTSRGNALIVHWSGSAWARVPSPAPAGSRLSGVAATPDGRAWAVGCSSCSDGVGEPLILYWNGTVWAQVSSPTPAGTSITRVAATSATNAWAIGSTSGGKPLMLRWNGTAWELVPIPVAAGSAILGVAASSVRDAWAVGFNTRSGKTLILHWNGTAWKRVPSPSPDANMGAADILDAMATTSAAGVWAVGEKGNCGCGPSPSLIERWNGRVWKQVRSPSPGGGTDLGGVAAVSANRAWAVGATGEGDSPTKPVILRWNGAAWTRAAIPSAGAYGELAGVSATSPTNAWAVGSTYTEKPNSHDPRNFKTVILHWNGSKWT